MSNQHYLKTLPEYFNAVENGTKPFEVRKNDRNYQVGDTLHLQEYSNGAYTGREISKKICYILDNPAFCKDGFVVLGLANCSQPQKSEMHEQIEGEWIFEFGFYGKMLCSNCKEEALVNECNEYVDSDFCPNCGAYMKGGAE